MSVGAFEQVEKVRERVSESVLSPSSQRREETPSTDGELSVRGANVPDAGTREATGPAGRSHDVLQLQRRIGNRAVGRLLESERETVAPDVHSPISGPAASQGPGGRPLSPAERAFFEPRFGRGLGDVRLHDDRRAAWMNEALGAEAFTYGSDVFFRSSPRVGVTGERALLAHELAHVVQQRGIAPTRPRTAEIEAANGAAEREATVVGARVAAGEHTSVTASSSTPVVARQATAESAATPEAAEESGVWARVLDVLRTIGGGLMGEFNEDPSFAMIGVDTAVSLIPIVDQVADARDIVAHLYYLIVEKQYDRFLRWAALVFTLIGLIPEVGSAIKGASKFVIKGVREVLSRIGEFLAPLRRLVPDLLDFGRIRRYVSERWDAWMARGQSFFYDMFARVSAAVERIPWPLSRLSVVDSLKSGVARVRELAPQKLQQAAGWIREQWESVLEQLNRRQSDEAAEGVAAAGAGGARRAEPIVPEVGGIRGPARTTEPPGSGGGPARVPELEPGGVGGRTRDAEGDGGGGGRGGGGGGEDPREQLVRLLHKRELGWDPAVNRFRPLEAEQGFALESLVGQRLTRYQGRGADWVEVGPARSHRTYDAVGGEPIPTTQLGRSADQQGFLRQIDNHLRKQGLYRVVIDYTGMTDEQVRIVREYVESLPAAEQRRLIHMVRR